MKYKVGDKVRVRTDLKVGIRYSRRVFNEQMDHWSGRVVTIKKIAKEGAYIIREDGGRWFWVEEMFETNATDAIKPDYYERSAMQPLEVMQRIMTAEQFEGFLLGNCIKYRMRCENKGQRDSDMYKARQYAYWLEMTKEGRIINPSEDRVPDSYRFKVV